MYKNVLIVDDNEGSRKIASYFMSKMNVKILEAENGENALSYLLNEKLDLVILDWKMPVLNGSDTILLTDYVLNQVKTSQVYKRKKLEVILYTSVKLNDLELPQSSNFRLLGYIHKNWSLYLQNRKFHWLVKSLNMEKIA